MQDDNKKEVTNLLPFPDKFMVPDYAISTHIYNLIQTFGLERVQEVMKLFEVESDWTQSEGFKNVSSEKS